MRTAARAALALLLTAIACSDEEPRRGRDRDRDETASPRRGSRVAQLEPLEASITSTDATHYEIDLDVVVQALLYGVADDLRAVPIAGGGGYRVEALRAGSIFDRLGLAKGDVVAKVNGLALDGPEALVEAYRALRLTGSVEVAIVRDGAPQTLVYRVNPARGPSYVPPPAASTDPPVSLSPDEEAFRAALDKGIKKIDDTHYEVSRELLEKVLSDPTIAARGARIVPSVRDGKANGFKLYAIRPNSVYARLGLQNGDTITAVNGHDLTSPDKALEVYTKVKSARKLTVSLIRRGIAGTLHYEIVD